MRRASLTTIILVVSSCFALVAAACSGDDGERLAPTTSPSSTASSAPGTSASSSTSAAAVPPSAAANPPPGQFEVVGTDIIGPDGRPFVPIGTNMNGPNSFFDVTTKGRAAQLQQQWAFNTIRLVTCQPSGCQGQLQTANNDLDGIVAEYTGRGMVVMIDYHQLGFGAVASAADVQQAVSFWTDIATRFKNNAYVWFNLFNEPDASYNDAAQGSTAPARWRAQHQSVIDAIRATGATNVIVIDDTQAGMGAADFWNIDPSPAAQSGVLSEGASLVDPAKRLVFSFHAYDVWGFPNDGSETCQGRYSDDQRDARLRSYIDRVHAAGFPLLIGELGFRVTDQATTGVSYHGEGGGQPPCGSTMLLAAEATYRVALPAKVGVIVWHGFDVTTEGGQAWELVGSPPTNLTHLGKMQWDYAQRLAGR